MTNANHLKTNYNGTINKEKKQELNGKVDPKPTLQH